MLMTSILTAEELSFAHESFEPKQMQEKGSYIVWTRGH